MVQEVQSNSVSLDHFSKIKNWMGKRRDLVMDKQNWWGMESFQSSIPQHQGNP